VFFPVEFSKELFRGSRGVDSCCVDFFVAVFLEDIEDGFAICDGEDSGLFGTLLNV